MSFRSREASSPLPDLVPARKPFDLFASRAVPRVCCFLPRRAIWTVLLLFLSGCGVQSPPRPPRVEQPKRVTDLAVAQTGHSLQLSFTAPALATDGDRLTKPLEFGIFRTIAAPGQKPSAPSPDSSPWVSIAAKTPDQNAAAEKITYAARLTNEEYDRWQGSTLSFTVRALTRGFRNRPIMSEISNAAQTSLVAVSGPVENLRVDTTEKALRLQWSPVPQTAHGRIPAKFAGYNVSMSRTGKPGSFERIGESRSEAYSYEHFEFGQSYFFKVRAVYTQDNWKAETEDSSVSLVVPRDTFPPLPPTGLTAVYATTGVELVWNANTEPDLGGYNVYRREDSGAASKLNKALVPTPVFTDATAQPGHEYSYWVDAVDLAGNGSSPSAEIQVDTK